MRLVERGDFGPKAAQRVRAALNRLRDDAEFAPAADRLRDRLGRAVGPSSETAAVGAPSTPL